MSTRIALSFFCLLALAWRADAAPPLSLAEAQAIAARQAPQLTAQSASVRAAREASLGAGELPDPKLLIGIDNLPVDGADRFSTSRDFMTMRKVGVMQDFTRGEKLKLRIDRAKAEVRKEEAMLALTEVNLKRDVALAWVDLYFAERQLVLLRDAERESQLQISAAQAALAGGKGSAGDPFAARLVAAQLADRVIEAERTIARAKTALSRWIGSAADNPLDAPPAFDRLTHDHGGLLALLENHPHLAMYGPMQDMAQAEVKLAEAAKRPDWSLEVAYAQRGSAYSNMLSVGVRIDLPIFQSRRQDPAIAAKVAMAEQTSAQAEAARREHEAEVKAMGADWNAAKARVQRYDSVLMPLARERTDVTLAAYRGGKGDLMPILDARKAEIDILTGQLQAQAELARAWAQLNFLIPEHLLKAKP